METPLTNITDDASFDLFRALLRSSNLPADDLNYKKDLLVAYVEDGNMVGTGGLEVYGDYALLRSLSVKLGTRGKALGTQITEHLIAEARRRRLKGIFLFTESASGFFQRKGFTVITRAQVPDAVKMSSEFTHVCADTAVVMHLAL